MIKLYKSWIPRSLFPPLLSPHNDVIEGDELDKEANEAHETKANSSCYGYLGEFLSKNRSQVQNFSGLLFLFSPIGFGASLDQPDGVLPKLVEGLHCLPDLIQAPAFSSQMHLHMVEKVVILTTGEGDKHGLCNGESCRPSCRNLLV